MFRLTREGKNFLKIGTSDRGTFTDAQYDEWVICLWVHCGVDVLSRLMQNLHNQESSLKSREYIDAYIDGWTGTLDRCLEKGYVEEVD